MELSRFDDTKESELLEVIGGYISEYLGKSSDEDEADQMNSFLPPELLDTVMQQVLIPLASIVLFKWVEKRIG